MEDWMIGAMVSLGAAIYCIIYLWDKAEEEIREEYEDEDWYK